jgi:hypothetical protein
MENSGPYEKKFLSTSVLLGGERKPLFNRPSRSGNLGDFLP